MTIPEAQGSKVINVQPSTSKERGTPQSTNGKPSPAEHKDRPRLYAARAPNYKRQAAILGRSFKEVQITFANNTTEVFLAKEASAQKSKELVDVKKETEASVEGVAANVKTEKENPINVLKEEVVKVKKEKEYPVEIRQEEVVKKEKESGLEVNKEGEKKVKRKKKKKKIKKSNQVLPLDDTENVPTKSGAGIAECDDTKKKGKKTKSKKSKEANAAKEDEAVKEEIQKADESPAEGGDENSQKKRKPPCLFNPFGFITSWLAKRKQKRRDKKKKAIAARNSKHGLVDHKTSKGGEAFIIEVDDRSFPRKPLLPPIKQKPGPIHQDRYEDASERRAQQLERKKCAVKEYEKKKAKCKEKKFDKDVEFRNKTDLSIRLKQTTAERNRDNRSRCKSRLAKDQSSRPPRDPSPMSSIGSIHGPDCFDTDDEDYYEHALNVEDEFYDQELNVDKDVDIPVF